MLIIVGDTRSRAMIEVIKRQGFGRMWIASLPTPFNGEPWGFDNGAYAWWTQGKEFDETAFSIRLQAAISVGKPYLAIVPDIVAGGSKSLFYSLGWMSRLPKKWPWYLAVQDGMKEATVAKYLYIFDGLFLGGTDKFKATAQKWCDIAHEQHKPFHYGRAGTLRKLQHAFNVGADSCDSAFPLWTMERMVRFCAFNNDMRNQLRLA